MKRLLSILAGGLLFAGQAHAAAITFVEGGRSDAGTINFTDFVDVGGGYDVTGDLPDGLLSAGDRIDIFGIIFGAPDRVTVNAEDPFEFRVTGLNFQDPNAQLTINVLDATTLSPTNQIVLNAASDLTNAFFAFGAGEFVFEILQPAGVTQFIAFDIEIVATNNGGAPVPVPAAIPLMLVGLAGGAYVRRRTRASAK